MGVKAYRLDGDKEAETLREGACKKKIEDRNARGRGDFLTIIQIDGGRG